MGRWRLVQVLVIALLGLGWSGSSAGYVIDDIPGGIYKPQLNLESCFVAGGVPYEDWHSQLPLETYDRIAAIAPIVSQYDSTTIRLLGSYRRYLLGAPYDFTLTRQQTDAIRNYLTQQWGIFSSRITVEVGGPFDLTLPGLPGDRRTDTGSEIELGWYDQDATWSYQLNGNPFGYRYFQGSWFRVKMEEGNEPSRLVLSARPIRSADPMTDGDSNPASFAPLFSPPRGLANQQSWFTVKIVVSDNQQGLMAFRAQQVQGDTEHRWLQNLWRNPENNPDSWLYVLAYHPAKVSVAKLAQIRPGMTLEQIVGILGPGAVTRRPHRSMIRVVRWISEDDRTEFAVWPSTCRRDEIVTGDRIWFKRNPDLPADSWPLVGGEFPPANDSSRFPLIRSGMTLEQVVAILGPGWCPPGDGLDPISWRSLEGILYLSPGSRRCETIVAADSIQWIRRQEMDEPVDDTRSSGILASPELVSEVCHRLDYDYYWNAFDTQDTGLQPSLLAADSIPSYAIAHVRRWIPAIIKEGWLPDSWPERLIALKDYPYSRGYGDTIYSTNYTGDFFRIEYARANHYWIIVDDGSGLSVVVLFPDSYTIDPAVPEKAILDQVARLTTLPIQEVRTISSEIRNLNGIYSGLVLLNLTGHPEKIYYRNPMGCYVWWWHRMRVVTDGRFLAVHFGTWDGTGINLSPRPGLPSWF